MTKCRTFFWTFVIFPESKLDLIFISFFWALHSFQKAPNCIFNFLESKWNFTCAVKQFWKHPNMMKVNNIDRNSKKFCFLDIACYLRNWRFTELQEYSLDMLIQISTSGTDSWLSISKSCRSMFRLQLLKKTPKWH